MRRITLRLGDRAPAFRLPTARGEVVTQEGLRGKWALLLFVDEGCGPCERELADIVASYSQWRPRLNLVTLLLGHPLLGSPDKAVLAFTRRLHLPGVVATDPERKTAGAYCDQPLRTPFSVLLDPAGRVRFVQDGRQEGEFGLVSSVREVLDDRPFGLDAMLRQSGAFGRRAADGWVGQPGGRLRLSELWSRQPVLLSFLLSDCAACATHLTQVERSLGAEAHLEALYVYPSRRQARESLLASRPKGRVGWDETGSLHASYQVWRAPTTFLIYRGRLLFASGDADEPASDRELVQLLRPGRSWTSAPFPTVGSFEAPRR